MGERLMGGGGYLALCCLLQGGYGLVSMWFAVVLNDVATAAGEAGSFDRLLRVGLGALAWGIAYPVTRAVADSVTQAYGEWAAGRLRERLNRAILSMDQGTFAQEDTGDYLNRMTGDTLLIRDQYLTQLPLLAAYTVQFVFCVAYAFLLNPVVGGVLTALSAAQYCIPLCFSGAMQRLTLAQSQRNAQFTSKAKELLLGFSVIGSFGAQEEMEREFEGENRRLTQARTRAAALRQVMASVNVLVALMLVLISVLTAGWFVVEGSMAPATLLTVFYLGNRYAMPVMDFVQAYTQIKGSRGVRARMEDFLLRHPAGSWPGKGGTPVERLEAQHLDFDYGEGPVLRDVCLRLEKGKRYLLLGESGCGKSTLLKALAGQYPLAGVCWNGQSLARGIPTEARGRVVLVGQQPYLFHRSVAGNIDLLGTGDDRRLRQVIQSCCLEDTVAALPQGMDTLVDEERRALSGGQKARIGLARALYARPDALLLDEVTAALDPDTARRVERMVLELEGVLVLHAAHKPDPELMERYDQVITMDQGRIAEIRRR